jgi:hypothetical protein
MLLISNSGVALRQTVAGFVGVVVTVVRPTG